MQSNLKAGSWASVRTLPCPLHGIQTLGPTLVVFDLVSIVHGDAEAPSSLGDG